MKRLTATFPGKIGDALHQFPVMFWHWQQTQKKFDCWMDENTLKPLENLFASQPCVDQVLLKPGIKSWHMGGQPYTFDLTTKDHEEREFVHLGFRLFPQRQITLETLQNVPLNIERRDTAVCLTVNAPPISNRRLVLHGSFTSHNSGVPSIWRFIADHATEFESLFDEIAFVGAPGERQRALELYSDWTAFDDGGDFLKLAEFMAPAKLVIGCGSSNVVLAGLLGVPSVRVHDPIGEFPKVIWNNLGAYQINETERDLRVKWPEFRDQVLGMTSQA